AMVVQDRQRFTPRVREVDRGGYGAVDSLGERHVRSRVRYHGFAQRRIAGMRQYLVDAASGHHVAGQEGDDFGVRPRRHTTSVRRLWRLCGFIRDSPRRAYEIAQSWSTSGGETCG